MGMFFTQQGKYLMCKYMKRSPISLINANLNHNDAPCRTTDEHKESKVSIRLWVNYNPV